MTGHRIVAMREALGFTQRDLSRILNVDLQTVRRWERSIELPFKPGPRDDPSLQNVSSPPAGLARAVLTGIEHAVQSAEGDAARLAEFSRRLSLGLAAMIVHGMQACKMDG